MIDRQKFFALIKGPLFSPGFRTSQIAGMNAILDLWVNRGGGDLRYLAYELTTAYRETARTMQPIEEYGHGKGRPYGVPMGLWHQVYDGRGDVQLTWEANYKKATMRLRTLGLLKPSEDLEKNPELALRPDIAGAIMAVGMVEGWFSGKKLSDYFNSKISDWVGARHIINGSDHALEIANNGKIFYAALKATYAPLITNNSTKSLSLISGDMNMINDPKPWYTSQGVLGSVSAIIASLGAAYFAYSQKDMAGVSVALVAAAAAFHGLVGRLKANSPIGKPSSTIINDLEIADSALQIGAEFLPKIASAVPAMQVDPAPLIQPAAQPQP